MRLAKIQLKFLAFILAAVLFTAPVNVCAASGTVYTCNITPTYKHPVTGKIEDSGGSSSYATGQGMVEGAVASKGLLEAADSGEYYLNIRMSLVDYTSNHSFSVQKKGASGWSKASMAVTANGKDDNGKTADICIQVLDKDCIVRCSMYVEPMGRNVIFYFYPSDFSEGNSSGMKASMVTKASKGSQDQESDSESSNQQTTEDTAVSTDTAAKTETSELDNAQGLSLSTKETETSSKKKSGSSLGEMGKEIVILTTSMTLSGLILLAVAAGIVYYYRRNWNRWGEIDDYEDEE